MFYPPRYQSFCNNKAQRNKHHNLADKEFQTAVLKQFNELHNDNSLKSKKKKKKKRTTMSSLPKREKCLKMNQTEIVELHNLVNEVQNAVESICSKADGRQNK